MALSLTKTIVLPGARTTKAFAAPDIPNTGVPVVFAVGSGDANHLSRLISDTYDSEITTVGGQTLFSSGAYDNGFLLSVDEVSKVLFKTILAGTVYVPTFVLGTSVAILNDIGMVKIPAVVGNDNYIYTISLELYNHYWYNLHLVPMYRIRVSKLDPTTLATISSFTIEDNVLTTITSAFIITTNTNIIYLVYDMNKSFCIAKIDISTFTLLSINHFPIGGSITDLTSVGDNIYFVTANKILVFNIPSYNLANINLNLGTLIDAICYNSYLNRLFACYRDDTYSYIAELNSSTLRTIDSLQLGLAAIACSAILSPASYGGIALTAYVAQGVDIYVVDLSSVIPDSPIGFKATCSDTPGSINLSWDAGAIGTDASAYTIEAANSPAGPFVVIVFLDYTQVYYTETGIAENQARYYRMRTFSGVLLGSNYSDYTEIVTVQCNWSPRVPLSPQNVTVIFALDIIGTDTYLSNLISWEYETIGAAGIVENRIDGFKIYRMRDDEVVYTQIGTVIPSVFSYYDMYINLAHDYSYQVRAYNAQRDGMPSEVVSILSSQYYTPAAPVLTVLNDGVHAVALSWFAITNATEYKIYRQDLNSLSPFVYQGTISALLYTDLQDYLLGLGIQKTFNYKVVALFGTKMGPDSNIVQTVVTNYE